MVLGEVITSTQISGQEAGRPAAMYNACTIRPWEVPARSDTRRAEEVDVREFETVGGVKR